MNRPKEDGGNRREFLKLATVSAPAAAAAAVVLSAEPAAAEDSNEISTETRLRETPHTRAYFATAGF